MYSLQHIAMTKTAPKLIVYIPSQFAGLTLMSTAFKNYSKNSQTVISKQFGNISGSGQPLPLLTDF